MALHGGLHALLQGRTFQELSEMEEGSSGQGLQRTADVGNFLGTFRGRLEVRVRVRVRV
jgi:hypothetical protein